MAGSTKRLKLLLAGGICCLFASVLMFVSFKKEEFGRQPLPPEPADTIIKPVDFEALMRYRSLDQVAIKKLLSEDEKHRNEAALKQLETLVPFYLSWANECTVTEGGLKVYGPRAAVWLNEILWSMAQREDILHGYGRYWESRPPKERAPGARYWFSLGGLDGNPYIWSIEGKTSEIPEEEARSAVVSALKDIKYPFCNKIGNKIFSGVEMYVLPSAGMFDNSTSAGMCAVGRTTGRGYSPEDVDRLRTGPKQVRILIAGVEGINRENTLCHELGHAWVRVLRNHGAKNVLAAWAEWRKPYIPEGVDPSSFADDYRVTGNWSERPEEVLAEDFVRLFGGGNGRDNWPRVEDPKTRERLARFFAGEVVYE